MTDPLDTYVERSVEAVLQDVLPGWVAASGALVTARTTCPRAESSLALHFADDRHHHFQHVCMRTRAVTALSTCCRLKCRCFFGHQQLPGGSFVALQRCAQVPLDLI
jgi:hypothetical protein